MKNYNIFYTIPDDRETQIELIKDALDKCYESWIDVLEVSSFSRKHCKDKSIQDIIDMYLSDDKYFRHFVFINRLRGDLFPDAENIKNHLEIGLNVSKAYQPTYFLFIYVDEEHLQWFIDKYKLQKLEV